MQRYIKLIGFSALFALIISCGDQGKEPEIRWKFTSAAFLSSPAIGPDNTIYAFSENDTLYAFNQDGSVKWRLGLPDTIWYHPSNILISPVVAQDNTIYLFAVDGCLYSINSGGSINWRLPIKPTFPTIYGTPALGANGTIYVYAPESLYAVSPAGVIDWVVEVGGGSCITFPAVGADGTIYIGADRDLIALNPDGSVKWSFDMAPAISTIDRLAIGADRTVYVFGTGIDDAGNLLAFSDDGSLRWTCTLEDSDCISIGTPVIGIDGTVYLGSATSSARGWLYAVSPSGEVRWKKQSTSLVQEAYDLAIDSEGTIYGVEGAFTPDGNLKWRYPIGTTVVNSLGAPAIGSDGTVYIGCGTGLFAFNTSAAGLAQSSWPRSRHDNRNSGNVLTQ
ncbi:MAG: PQQ-binding-like beta-propeller repeat protein [candidate division WOR-3 bacterium]